MDRTIWSGLIYKKTLSKYLEDLRNKGIIEYKEKNILLQINCW